MPTRTFLRKPPLAAAAALVAASVALGHGAPAAAQGADPAGELQRLDESLRASEIRRDALRRRADRAVGEIAALKRQMVEVAQRARNHDNMAGEIERRLARLQAREEVTSRSLQDRRAQLTATLAALQRLARRPAAAMLARPADPADTVRGAILMRAAVPELDARARALGAELVQLTALRDDIAAERSRLVATAAALGRDRQRLAALIDDKRALERRTRRESRSEQVHGAALAARARSLRDLVDRLTAARGNLRRGDMAPKPAELANVRPAAGVADADASLLPASGRVVRQFGTAGGDGGRAEGITIQTRPAAHVAAPRRGTVVFAGPFRGYGQLLIIEHDQGYHVLLAGLDRIDAVVGDEVLAGEPVGSMTASSNRTPKLYLELRRSGRPINPLPWLAASRTKVSG